MSPASNDANKNDANKNDAKKPSSVDPTQPLHEQFPYRQSRNVQGLQRSPSPASSRWQRWRASAAAGSLAINLLAAHALRAQAPLDLPNAQETQSPPASASVEAGAEAPSQVPAEGAPSLDSQSAAAVHDPPSRVARLSVLNGNVSTEPASANTFVAGEVNDVLTTGDRVYTDAAGGAAELEAGQLALRLGAGTDLSVSALTDTVAQFGVASGAVHLRSFNLVADTEVELDSPDAAVTVLDPGDVRVDVDAAAHTTTVSVLTGRVQVDSPGATQILTAGQRIRLHGGDPAMGATLYTEPLALADADALDSFSGTRDSAYSSGTDAISGYVSPDTVGGADLAGAGAWDASDDGPIWYPVVATGWRPYCDGHWRYLRPWGWTWIGNEPWGFAPFHYGRWTLHGGRWGWIPGSPVVRPVYAPALVAFAGGTRFSAAGANAGRGGNGNGSGTGGTSGIAAWFPLGPHEPYLPPYSGTVSYRNRVNASNIYNANPAEVRALYSRRAADAFPAPAPADRTYGNRLVGTVAVSETNFAEGRPVARSFLPLSAESLAAAPVLAHAPKAPVRLDHPRDPNDPAVVAGPALAQPPTLARPSTLPGILPGQTSADLAHGATAAAPAPGVTFFHRVDPPSRPLYGAPQRTFSGTESPASNRATGQHEIRPAPGAIPRGEAPRAAPAHPAPAPSSTPAPSGRPH